MSEGADVGFGVYLKTRIGERQRAGEMTEVLPNQRYNAHLVPEDGSLTCSVAGVCKWLPLLCCWELPHLLAAEVMLNLLGGGVGT